MIEKQGRYAKNYPAGGTYPMFFVRCLPILLMLAWTSESVRASDTTKILFPPDLTLSSEASIRVFAFRTGKAAPLPVFVNGKPMGVLEGKSFQKGEVRLSPGLNRIQAGPRVLRVYHLPGAVDHRFSLPAGKGIPSLVYRSVRLHPALIDG